MRSGSAWDDLLAAYALCAGDETWEWFQSRAEPVQTMSEQGWARLGEFLRKNKELLAELRAFAAAGQPWYEIDLSDPANLRFDHFSPMRDFARLLAAQCVCDRHTNDVDAAFENLVAVYQVGEVLAEEPLVISQLVRLAIHGIGQWWLESTFQPGDLTPEQSRALIEVLHGIDYQTSLSQSLYIEAERGLSTFDCVRAGEISGVAYVWGDRLFFRVYGSSVGRPWLNLDEGAYAMTMQRAAETAGQPYFEGLGMMREIQEEVDRLPYTRVMTRRFVAAEMRCLAIHARYAAMRDLCWLGLSVETYATEHGEYPATLEVAVPAHQLPPDPYTGQDFRYTHTQDGFTLYSLGPDGVDVGGTQGSARSQEGDLVWRGTQQQSSM
ncbi:MAG: hypothetical protein HYV26_10690 [Candidatus Hydrogenedentes bacterium]|nr:hypothetical protein [Candidatus Hydrogenedentota bacterium]